VPASAIDRTLALMPATFEYATVDRWERLADQLHLPDPDDPQVLAAGITSAARTIVTANLRHFPAANWVQNRVKAASPEAGRPIPFIRRTLARYAGSEQRDDR
jgi:hypothetical protein